MWGWLMRFWNTLFERGRLPNRPTQQVAPILPAIPYVPPTIDQIPDAFSFTSVTDAALSTVYTSNTITVSGVTPSTDIVGSLSGAGFTYSKNGGAYQAPGSFTFQNGDTFTLRGTSSGSNSTGETAVLSLGIMIGNWSVTTVAPAGLATPTLNNSSALGAAPLVLSVTDADYDAGLYLQLQIDQTSSAFSNITQNLVFLVDGASWATLDEAIGLATPPGQYWARVRAVRDNDSGGTTVTGTDPSTASISFLADVSSWSTTFTDTIVSSAAALNTVTGVNKNSFAVVSGSPALTYTSTAGNYGPVRTSVEQASNKAQFELTIISGATTDFTVALEDGTFDLSQSFKVPSFTGAGNTGVGVEFNGGSVININQNDRASQTALVNSAGTIQNGDIFTIVFDKTAHTIEVYRTRSGSTTQMGTTTGSISTYSHYYLMIAGLNSAFSGTLNCGGTTYAKTPSGGVAAIWA